MSIKRNTRTVQLVLDAFERSADALSVVDLVNQFEGEMNKTTVYRILERLEQQGTLHSFLGRDGLTWYARCSGCSETHHKDTHPHFQCTDCGKIECLQVDIAIPPIPGHRVDSAELLLVGQCGECGS